MSDTRITSTQTVSAIALLSWYLLAGGPALAASPNLWWDHLGPLDVSQAECVAKGKQLLSANNAGKIRAGEDSLHAKNDTTISVIECLSFGKGITVSVVVSSNDVEKGDKLFNRLKNGMTK
ncbi:MAG: hypothetical protein L0Y38_05970 [Methylococcaceae bacterium]|nr:hypothetical protein [Methylococcaceae bacterium]MCI0668699.1 hypothetical protein [Methylococcaceae bacterium]MCI0733352.1 hypothetical protein [Methylococcaceae bacterium]